MKLLKFKSLIIFFVFNNFLYSQVKNENNEYYKVNNIVITGNKHTKNYIIERELLLKKNDTIDKNLLNNTFEKSRQNLLNTSLFNFVTITALIDDTTNKIDIKIELIERWYLWPIPIVELADRNFNAWWQERDFSRVTAGLNIIHENFRGRRENLTIGFALGYNMRFTLNYTIPYLNKEKTFGLGFYASYSANRELPYKTQNDKLQFYRADNYYLSNEINTYIEALYRPVFYQYHTFRITYDQYYYNDSLLILNPEISERKKNQSAGLYYQLKLDHRDNKSYSLKGWYIDLDITKKGIFSNGNLNVLMLHATARKFWKIYNRFYYGAELSGKYNFSNELQYNDTKALGYLRDYVRGYEYYVIDGDRFLLGKTNLKFELLAPRKYNLKFIKTEKFSKIHFAFYINVFIDAAYVYKKDLINNNKLPNTLLYSGGLGIDFVTYYDKVLRFEYTINRNKEKGFFISFMAAL